MAHLAERLLRTRTKAGLSVRDVALRTKTSQGSVNKYERGLREPRIGYVVRFAKLFRLSLDALVK